MRSSEKQERLDLIGDLAAEQLHHFEGCERARIYEGLSIIYSGEKAQVCKFAALSLRKAEEAQLKFRELLKQ